MTGGGARRSRWLFPSVLAIGLAGCTRSTSDGPISQSREAELGGGILARVGDSPVFASTVASVMSAQGVTSEEALERVVRDALFSAHARAQPPLRDRARGVEQAMLARVLLEQFRREAEARPVTDDDIRAAMAERFLEFDRPPMVKVIHAVVRFTAPGDEPRARTVADAIRRAVVDVKDEAAFRSAASAVPNDGFEVAIEALAPLAADGRVAPGRGMVEPFARAAHAIASIGGTSPVTRTKYGLHVIRLIERQPALFVPVAEARPRLEASVRTARLREAYDGLVRGLAAREPSTIDPASGELMGLIDLEL